MGVHLQDIASTYLEIALSVALAVVLEWYSMLVRSETKTIAR
jgi:hypothetical protein